MGIWTRPNGNMAGMIPKSQSIFDLELRTVQQTLRKLKSPGAVVQRVVTRVEAGVVVLVTREVDLWHSVSHDLSRSRGIVILLG